MFVSVIGWVGSICFAGCGFPQVYQCWKQGHAKGISAAFLVLWLVGEVCYVTALLMTIGWIWWMMFNYIISLACLLAICRFRFFPR